MEWIIGIPQIPGELWKVRGRFESEEAALLTAGEKGAQIVEVNIRDKSALIRWQWDGCGWHDL